MSVILNRRRFITVSAAAAGLSLLPRHGKASDEIVRFEWHGQALGAPASLVLHHHERRTAKKLVDAVVAELERMERVFSLYRENSALSLLNDAGFVLNPPPELLDLLGVCGRFHALTGGAFDPTLQPLWLVYAKHFSSSNPDPAGPPRDEIRKGLEKVDFGRVSYNPDRVMFKTPGMALTMNGIAQGYITDRIVRLLRRSGISSSLIDMGEVGSIGTRPDGSPWRVGVPNGEHGDIYMSHDLVDRAVATSSRGGFCFDSAGRFSHLLDPRSGAAASSHNSITVVAPDATTADAMSTAFHLMSDEAIASMKQAMPELQIYRFAVKL